jgi:F-type H+-transporting ATPase subunit gamma
MGEGKEVKIFCVGRKGFDILRRIFPKQIVETVELRNVKQIGFADADQIGQKVLGLFAAGAFDVCTLFYAEFRSVISQIPTTRQLIPAQITAPDQVPASGGAAIYEYEPDEESILADLLPRNLSVQVFRALLENAASEQGAKMSAMDNATRNAGDMINRLSIQYNRQRQAAITTELVEIISGAEAL